MWGFLGKVAENHGPILLICIIVLCFFSMAITLLWRETKYLQRVNSDSQKLHKEEMAAIQEKRLTEAKRVSKESMELVNEVNESTSKLVELMNFLREFGVMKK